MRKTKEQGITIITLVVTIIILVILAGISVNTLIGDKGIIKQAQKDKENILLEEDVASDRLNQLYFELEEEEISIDEGSFSTKDEEIKELQKELNNLKALLAQTTATEDKILKDYVAYSKGNLIIGKMPNNGAINKNLVGGESYNIPKGYHNGEGVITAEDSAIKIEDLKWNYITISAKPGANSISMSWDVTSIPNYEKLELNKTLNPVMVSNFDMGNWDTSQNRAWKIKWSYDATRGKLAVTTTGGPMIQYGTGISPRTVGIYYLEF